MYKNAGCTLYKVSHIFTVEDLQIRPWHKNNLSSKENAICKFRSCVNEVFVLNVYYVQIHKERVQLSLLKLS